MATKPKGDIAAAVAAYRAREGTQPEIAKRFGITEYQLGRSLKAVLDTASDQASPESSQNTQPPDAALDGEERRERRAEWRSWVALGIALASLVYGGVNGRRIEKSEERNRQLATRVEAATDAANANFADHGFFVIIRNASPRPMSNVRAVPVDVEGDYSSLAARSQIELGEISGCVDARYDVADSLQRKWNEASDGPYTPRWYLVWTDAGGQQWQFEALVSDDGSDTQDGPFDGGLWPPSPPAHSTLDLSRAPAIPGLTETETTPLAGMGSCG